MQELLEQGDPALTAEVMHFLLNGWPLPVYLSIHLRSVGINPEELQQHYDIY